MDKVNNLINTSYALSHLSQNKPLVSYSGNMDAKSIPALLVWTENELLAFKIPSDTIKRILGITTELLQNIYHHCPAKTITNTEAIPSFSLEKRKQGFLLITTNSIPKNKVTTLKKRITALNSYTGEELKKLYQNTLKNAGSVGENAGLGLIDIIRKSGNKILFKFASIDNNYCLFTVKVLV